MSVIHIALADDQLLFRQGIASLIHADPAFSLLLEADNGQHFLDQLEGRDILPDIALVDLEMPVLDGMQLNEILHRSYPSIKVVILSVHARERVIARMIEAGASGYLFKNCDKAELIAALKAVHHSGFYINNEVLRAIQKAATLKAAPMKNVQAIPIELTAREQEVLRLICGEKSNQEIADALFISVRTVEGHRKNLLAKIGCHNTAGLVLFAVKHHIYEIAF